jgi:hypothetical protein
MAEQLAHIQNPTLQDIGTAMFAALQESAKDIDQYDTETQERFWKNLRTTIDAAKDALWEVPDSPDVRRVIREAAKIDREHLNIREYLSYLQEEPRIIHYRLTDAEGHCCDALQLVQDIIFDACMRGTMSGPAAFGMICIMGECVSNLLAATHLAKHGYCNQATSLIRVAHEAINLASLFHKDGTAADLWASSKHWQEKWARLAPYKVLTELGRSEDPGYAWFSECAHTAFRSVQSVAYKVGMLEGRPQLRFLIGGVKDVGQMLWVHGWILYTAGDLVVRSQEWWGDRLNATECAKAKRAMDSRVRAYMIDFVLPYAKRRDFDTKPFEHLLMKAELWN